MSEFSSRSDLAAGDASAGQREHTYACNCRAESQDDEICHICSQIDFERVLSHNNLIPLKGPKTIFNLRDIAISNCPFCKFLRDCCPETSDLEDGDGFSKYWLKVGRVSPVFGTKMIADAPALQIYVQRRHKIPESDRNYRPWRFRQARKDRRDQCQSHSGLVEYLQ
jgi:hypothetical protein